MLKARHLEKEEYISRLAQDKEEMKVSFRLLLVQALASLGWEVQVELLFLQVKLLELQELVLRLVNERNEWQGKFLAVSQNPADVPAPVPTGSQEFGAADQQGGE